MIWARTKTVTEAAPGMIPDISLEGFRVNMRPPRAEDFPQWQTVRRANRDYLQPFEPTWPENCLSDEFLQRRLLRQTRQWRSGQACSFLIFDKSGGLIGGININEITRGISQQASLGYWIAQDVQGQGYMSEAMRLTIQYCFEAIGLHRVNAACLLHNQRSENLLRRAGFTEEGMAKKYLKINGQWQDHILFGLTIEDWAAGQNV